MIDKLVFTYRPRFSTERRRFNPKTGTEYLHHEPTWEVTCRPGYLVGVGRTYREALQSCRMLIQWTLDEDGPEWFLEPESR